MALAVPVAATADPIDGNKPQPVSQSAQPAPPPPPDQTAGPQAVPSPGATSALAAIQSRIASQVATKGNTYTFGSYLDPGTGKIVIETDAPASVVSSLTNLPGAASAAERQAASQVQVRRTTTTDTFSRRDDISPFYGGGGLLAAGALCSSGYAVRNSAGTVFMVTAGHCYANGTSVRTESNAQAYGTVSNRRLDSITHDAKDMELIGGKSYAGRVFTGGVTSSTSIPVVSAGAASVGFNNYCHSGRTTGEQCGHTATSTTAQVCTTTGCKSPVIAYTGGTVQQGGDSGGTFYAKDSRGAFIRGHVIAGNSTTGYIEPWAVLAATYGVSIVTG
jgi:hypothetical protein